MKVKKLKNGYIRFWAESERETEILREIFNDLRVDERTSKLWIHSFGYHPAMVRKHLAWWAKRLCLVLRPLVKAEICKQGDGRKGGSTRLSHVTKPSVSYLSGRKRRKRDISLSH